MSSSDNDNYFLFGQCPLVLMDCAVYSTTFFDSFTFPLLFLLPSSTCQKMKYRINKTICLVIISSCQRLLFDNVTGMLKLDRVFNGNTLLFQLSSSPNEQLFKPISYDYYSDGHLTERERVGLFYKYLCPFSLFKSIPIILQTIEIFFQTFTQYPDLSFNCSSFIPVLSIVTCENEVLIGTPNKKS